MQAHTCTHSGLKQWIKSYTNNRAKGTVKIAKKKKKSTTDYGSSNFVN